MTVNLVKLSSVNHLLNFCKVVKSRKMYVLTEVSLHKSVHTRSFLMPGVIFLGHFLKLLYSFPNILEQNTDFAL